MKTKWIFNAASFFKLILKYESIIRMYPDLMVFTLEMIYKNKGWGI